MDPEGEETLDAEESAVTEIINPILSEIVDASLQFVESPRSSNLSRTNSFENVQEDQGVPMVKPTFKSILQAKKRLQAYSMAKQGSPNTKLSDGGDTTGSGDKSDKNEKIKKAKKVNNPTDKAKAVVMEIEAIKKEADRMIQRAIRSRSSSSERRHFKRRSVNRRNYRRLDRDESSRKSGSPERKRRSSPKPRLKSPKEKLVYPKDWGEYKKQNLDVHSDNRLKSKLNRDVQDSERNLMSKFLNFENPSPSTPLFKYRGEKGEELIPFHFVRITQTRPALHYSVNFHAIKDCSLSRKQVFQHISKARREQIELLFKSSRLAPVFKKLEVRKWYQKAWKCEPTENNEKSFGLSFIQSISEAEEEIEKQNGVFELSEREDRTSKDGKRKRSSTSNSEDILPEKRKKTTTKEKHKNDSGLDSDGDKKIKKRDKKKSKDKKSKKKEKSPKRKSKSEDSKEKKDRMKDKFELDEEELFPLRPKDMKFEEIIGDDEFMKMKENAIKIKEKLERDTWIDIEGKRKLSTEDIEEQSKGKKKKLDVDEEVPELALVDIKKEKVDVTSPETIQEGIGNETINKIEKEEKSPDTDEYHSNWESDNDMPLDTSIPEKDKLNKSWESDEEIFERRPSFIKRDNDIVISESIPLEIPLNIRPRRSLINSEELDEKKEKDIQKLDEKYKELKQSLKTTLSWEESKDGLENEVTVKKEKLDGFIDNISSSTDGIAKPDILENEYEEFMKAVSSDSKKKKKNKKKRMESSSSESSSDSSDSENSSSSEEKSKKRSNADDFEIVVPSRDKVVFTDLDELFPMNFGKMQSPVGKVLPAMVPAPKEPVPSGLVPFGLSPDLSLLDSKSSLSQFGSPVVGNDSNQSKGLEEGRRLTHPIVFTSMLLPNKKILAKNDSLNFDDSDSNEREESHEDKVKDDYGEVKGRQKEESKKKDVVEEKKKEVVEEKKSSIKEEKKTDKKKRDSSSGKKTISETRKSPSPRKSTARRHSSPKRSTRESDSSKKKSPDREKHSPFQKRSFKRDTSPHRRNSSRRRSSSPKHRRRSISPKRRHHSRNSSLSPQRSLSPESKKHNSPLQTLKLSVADSTISDDLLPQTNMSNEEYYDSSGHRFFDKINNLTPVDSPKRIPLDVRINQVLGIENEKVPSYPPEFNPYTPPPNIERSFNVPNKVVQVGNMLQIVPTEDLSVMRPPNQMNEQVHQPMQKIVQVGNMLQIVPQPFPIMESVVEQVEREDVQEVAINQEKASAEAALKQKQAERRAERERRRQEREKRRKEKEKRRKEKERQKQLKLKIRTENMIKKALQMEEENEGANEEDDAEVAQWPPPEFVISTPLLREAGKSILIRREGESLRDSKKTVQFADGIKPGEGTSTSGGEELSSPPPTATKVSKGKRLKKSKIPRKLKKKKIKVKVVRTSHFEESSDEEDNLPPPSPPPGSPPPHIFPPRIKTHTINNIATSYTSPSMVPLPALQQNNLPQTGLAALNLTYPPPGIYRQPIPPILLNRPPPRNPIATNYHQQQPINPNIRVFPPSRDSNNF